jgi:uncharacterized protein
MPIAAAPAAALWSALLLILMLVLSVRVSQQRRAHKVSVGHGEHPKLEAAVRAFGNASEYIPAGIGALAVLAIAGASPLIVHAVGGSLFLGRLSHGIGMSTSLGLSLGRLVGMVLTWLAFLFSAIVLLLYAIG